MIKGNRLVRTVKRSFGGWELFVTMGYYAHLSLLWLGTFCYNGLLCPLVPIGWPKVPKNYKKDCWMEIEKRYLIDPDIVKPPDQMGWAMHILRVLKRNRRTKLKKVHIKREVTKEQLLAKTPLRVMEDQ